MINVCHLPVFEDSSLRFSNLWPSQYNKYFKELYHARLHNIYVRLTVRVIQSSHNEWNGLHMCHLSNEIFHLMETSKEETTMEYLARWGVILVELLSNRV
jgi:hypothetical protein